MPAFPLPFNFFQLDSETLLEKSRETIRESVDIVRQMSNSFHIHEKLIFTCDVITYELPYEIGQTIIPDPRHLLWKFNNHFAYCRYSASLHDEKYHGWLVKSESPEGINPRLLYFETVMERNRLQADLEVFQDILRSNFFCMMVAMKHCINYYSATDPTFMQYLSTNPGTQPFPFRRVRNNGNWMLRIDHKYDD